MQRTGCMGCLFGVHLEKEPNRFQIMKIEYPKHYNLYINGGSFTRKGLWEPNENGYGFGKVFDHMGIKY